VRLRVDAPGEQLALDVRVPVVLDLVVRPARELPGDQGPPGRRNQPFTSAKAGTIRRIIETNRADI
jgi:hypothetical protein